MHYTNDYSQAPAPFQNRRLKRSMIEWCMDCEYSHAMTFAFNRSLTVTNATKIFGQFCLELDRYRFDRQNVSGQHSLDRFQAHAFMEHVDTNIHIHAAAKLDPWLPTLFDASHEATLQRIWRKATNGTGDLKIVPIDDLEGWIYYITKEWRSGEPKLILPAHFHPN
jgi:hypothetical protein